MHDDEENKITADTLMETSITQYNNLSDANKWDVTDLLDSKILSLVTSIQVNNKKKPPIKPLLD